MIEEEAERLVLGVEDFRILVPISEIVSAHLFDSLAFERFNPLPSATEEE